MSDILLGRWVPMGGITTPKRMPMGEQRLTFWGKIAPMSIMNDGFDALPMGGFVPAITYTRYRPVWRSTSDNWHLIMPRMI
jgi:hypothetical protein